MKADLLIIEQFTGATHDSLGLTTYEKSIVFSGNDNVKRKNSDIYLDFCSYNYEKVSYTILGCNFTYKFFTLTY